MKYSFIVFTALASFVFMKDAGAQLPFEIFAGNKKSSMDLMFFRYFKNKNDKNSKFLFFNRNRASIDYKQTKTKNLPSFGNTEAISYNAPALKGFAPVLVLQVFNTGVYPKSGIQYYTKKNDLTVFSWIVTELLEEPIIDWFLLMRYEPVLGKVKLYSQLELVNALPTVSTKNYSFTQRFRTGIRNNSTQYGFAADLNQSGRNQFIKTHNLGLFIRQEF